jgi:hypothetical protein
MSTLNPVPRPALNNPKSQRTLRRVAAALPALSFVAAAVLFTPPPVWAQVPQQLSQQTASIDPPGRVARMNLAEGPVSYAPADTGGNPRWTPAVLNRPLTSGDRLWTGQRARSELHIGSTAVRLGEQTSLDFVELDDDTTRLRLAQGTMKLRVRNLFEGQRVEINTPNLAFVITQPGDYRIDAQPASNIGDGTTRVVVQQGAGTIYGDGGAAVNIASGQQANFTDTQLTPASPGPEVQDSFDVWALQRDRLEDQSVSARYVPREVVGYQQLDSYGDWNQDPTYGAVWLPRAVPANWAPYRDGHWSWIAPWGWTWVDDAPWGFAPFHYGRWAQIGPRWGWVPGRMAARPVYAPALVAFIGGNAGGVNWNVSIGQQRPRPGLGWFPLAPGEAFRPDYRHSPRYITNINQSIVVNNVTNNYRYQREGHAVSVMSAEDFARGQRVRPEGQRFNPADLGRAQLIAPERGGLPQRVANLRDLPRVASPAALPPAALAARPVVTSQVPQPGPRDERRNDRRDDRRDRPGEGVGQLPRPGLPVQPGQPVFTQPGAAPDRGPFDAEQRARVEQHRQQQERLQSQSGPSAQQGPQGLLGQPREQERQQRELARQQQERAGGQRPPGEESIGQRALREQAQRNANMNGNPNPAIPPARPDAGRDPIEQAQREQQRLQRDQQRQQIDAARQQEQQRRQVDESLGQRALQEQAQRQQQAQRQVQEQQAQQAQQTQQRAQQEQSRQQQAAQQQQQIQQRAQQDQQRQAQQQQQQQQQQRQQQDQARQQQATEQQAQQAQQRAQHEQQRQVREQQDSARQAAAQQQAQQAQQAQQRAQQDQARQQQMAQQQQQLIQQQQQQRQQPEQPRAAGRDRPPRPGEGVSGAPPEERFNRRRE